MSDTFHGEAEGCFLYSRHWNPSNKYLADAIARMEGAEEAWVTASGMAAITNTILHICNTGDHIVSSMTTYGGTFAFLENYLTKFQIKVTFVDITNISEVEAAILPNTKLIYTESVTNPLLRVSDIPALASIANKHNVKLVIDNTFTPMIVSPIKLGAHIVVYSMTKFINGKNDCIAGAICGNKEFIDSLIDVNTGTAMLLGPVLDPLRSSGILKNLHSLHIRMKQHSYNAQYLAEKFSAASIRTVYPGLSGSKDHEVLTRIMNPGFGYGGVITIDLATAERANKLMEMMELEDVGYLAVSLGYFKTLFSNPGKSTSSEVPEEIQLQMGLSEGLIRFSVGLDNDIERTWNRIENCIKTLGL
jgi:methionine-gamma-lyase